MLQQVHGGKQRLREVRECTSRDAHMKQRGCAPTHTHTRKHCDSGPQVTPLVLGSEESTTAHHPHERDGCEDAGQVLAIVWLNVDILVKVDSNLAQAAPHDICDLRHGASCLEIARHRSRKQRLPSFLRPLASLVGQLGPQRQHLQSFQIANPSSEPAPTTRDSGRSKV